MVADTMWWKQPGGPKAYNGAHECIGGRLRRPELCRLLSPVEQTGDTYPPGVQRVLSTPAFAADRGMYGVFRQWHGG